MPRRSARHTGRGLRGAPGLSTPGVARVDARAPSSHVTAARDLRRVHPDTQTRGSAAGVRHTRAARHQLESS